MSKRFQVHATPIPDLVTVEKMRLGDARGFFERLFCTEEFAQFGWTNPIVQINRSYTEQKGTIRGMHYQTPPFAEMKLVMCLKGEVFDVAVDIRAKSKTFLNWHGEKLSASNNRAMLIPEGFAHGFQALTDEVEMLYFHTAPHQPSADAGVHPLDPKLNIRWPLSVATLSDKDAKQLLILGDFKGVEL